jgi:DNA polymerase-3 subunit epsilon
MVKDFNLCPKLCYLQKDPGECEGLNEGYCFGACEKLETLIEYNESVKKAIDSLQQQPTFAIIDNGLNGEDQSCILVCDGIFYGMGYLPADIQVNDLELLKDQLTIYKENSYIRNLVNSYAARFPGKVVHL